jgi:hypothetical protein
MKRTSFLSIAIFALFAIVAPFSVSQVPSPAPAHWPWTGVTPAPVPISASAIADSFGNPIANAKLCFAPVDANGNAVGFRVSQVQVMTKPVCGLVSNGVLQAGLSLASTPTGVYYHPQVLDRATGAVLRDYCTTQITGSSWSLDSYDCATAPVPPPAAGAITAGATAQLAIYCGSNPTSTLCGIPYTGLYDTGSVLTTSFTGSGAPSLTCDAAHLFTKYYDLSSLGNEYTCLLAAGSYAWQQTSGASSGSGSAITVDGASVSNPNLSSTTPAAGTGTTQVTFHNDGSGNVSATVPTPSGSGSVTASTLAAATYGVDTGAANAYVVMLSPAITAYADGLSVKFVPANNSTSTTPTLNLNGIGAATISKYGGGALVNGDIIAGTIATLIYKGAGWQLQNAQTPNGASLSAPNVFTAGTNIFQSGASATVAAKFQGGGAPATIALVTHTTGNPVTASLTVGNVGVMFCWSQNGGTQTVTDSLGNIWTAVDTDTTQRANVSYVSVFTVSGSDSIGVTSSAGGGNNCDLLQFSGVSPTSPIAAHTDTHGASNVNPQSLLSVTPTGSGNFYVLSELMLVGPGTVSGWNSTVSGFTNLDAFTGALAAISAFEVGATGTYGGVWTTGVTGDGFSGFMLALRPNTAQSADLVENQPDGTTVVSGVNDGGYYYGTPRLFSTLIGCSTAAGVAGADAVVSDPATHTVGATITGTGTASTPYVKAYCNGVNWVVVQ